MIPGNSSNDVLRTILLVDDDDEVSGVLADVLRDEGYDPMRARSSAEASAQARLRTPSLVLLDYRLDGEDGGHVVSRLRAEYGNALPIVLLSGVTELQSRAHELGVVATLPKPFGVEDLLRCLQTHTRH